MLVAFTWARSECDCQGPLELPVMRDRNATARIRARYRRSTHTSKPRHVRYSRAVVQRNFQCARTEDKERQRAAIVEIARSLAWRTVSRR
jgi:hypothetical protein